MKQKGKNESKGPMQSFNKIKAPHNELIPLLQNRSRLIRRFSTFFGMEPRNRLQVFSPFLVKAALIASIGGILFGYDLGVISSALPSLSQSFNLSNSQQENFVGVIYLGSSAGSAFGGFLCDYLGRKSGILLTDVIFMVGSLCLAFAHGVPILLIGRFIVGFAVSVSGIVDVSYLTEVSPSHWRGALVSCNEACISLGFLFSYTAGYVFNSLLSPETSWRVMFGFSGIIATAQFLFMMLFLPESPVWLEQQGRIADARLATLYINGGRELSATQEENSYSSDGGIALNSHYGGIEEGSNQDSTIEGNNNLSTFLDRGTVLSSHDEGDEDRMIAGDTDEGDNNNVPAWSSEVSFPPLPPRAISQTSIDNYDAKSTRREYVVTVLRLYFRQIIITLVLSSAQAFCGQGNILNYAPTIFANAGVPEDSTLLLLLGSVKFVSTALVILSVDRLGRRVLLLSGICIICMSLFALIIGFSKSTKISNAFTVFGTIGVVIGYSTSFGPLTWLITSEMFPSKIRGRALGGQAIVTGISSYLVSFTLLSGMDRYGDTAPFILYLVASSLALLFSWLAIPNTGDRTPSEINNDLNAMFLWRLL